MGQARKQVTPGSAGSLKFATIRQTEFIPAPPHEVYTAFTDPEKHSEFTGAEATGDPTVGSVFSGWDG